MGLPKARTCADCRRPLDYAGGHWMNVAPIGQRERIVCRVCWRTIYRKPIAPAAPARPAPAAQALPAPEPPARPKAPANLSAAAALAEAILALIGKTELRMRRHLNEELAKRRIV